jgi:hypothetical protein
LARQEIVKQEEKGKQKGKLAIKTYGYGTA